MLAYFVRNITRSHAILRVILRFTVVKFDTWLVSPADWMKRKKVNGSVNGTSKTRDLVDVNNQICITAAFPLAKLAFAMNDDVEEVRYTATVIGMRKSQA